jgi:hypothetical protein
MTSQRASQASRALFRAPNVCILQSRSSEAHLAQSGSPGFVVGIGGSAGGLKAYIALLESLPSDTGMAFVFIAHLSPTGKDLLTAILGRSTSMPAVQASEGLTVQANHIYVIPPNANLFLEKDVFRVVSPRTLSQGRHKQVDLFLGSLAESRGARAIGIILSGGDGDGTEGCKRIKEMGGRTFAQDLSAEHDSMPLHARASGAVDLVLPPDRIAEELASIGTPGTPDAPIGRSLIVRLAGVWLAVLLASCGSSPAVDSAATAIGYVPAVQKVVLVVIENESKQASLAQPFIAGLAARGALLNGMKAEARPSQPNYLAMISGDTFGVASNANVDLDGSHIGDLLEAQGKDWKAYVEGWPGNCFTGERAGNYVRKHNPFISFRNVSQATGRCARIVDSSQLDRDVAAGTLPDFSLYIPDVLDDGHDTGVAYASSGLERRFGPFLLDPGFMEGMLFIVTSDEGALESGSNQEIFTSLVGGSVKSGWVSNVRYNHYNLLRTIEMALGVGTLGKMDLSHGTISDIWMH